MSDWRDGLTSCVMSLVGALRALPPEPWRIPLMRAVASCANDLAQSGEPPMEAIDEDLRCAGREAAALSAAGRVPPELVDAIAEALNLFLSGSRAASSPPIGVPSARPVVLLAAQDRPLLHAVERESLGDTRLVPGAEDDARPGDEADEGGPGDIEGDDDGSPRPFELAPVDPFVPQVSPPPPVVLGDGGAPLPLRHFYEEVACSSLDWIALLARHRFERRVNERAREESRLLMLGDAFAASEHDCVGVALRWWQEQVDSPDPWKGWALAFALGTLDGDDIPVAITRALEMLPPHASRHAEIMAQALCVCPHPALAWLAEDLARSAHPVARGVGVDLLSRYQKLSPDQLARHLSDPNPAVLLAAFRGLLTLPRPLPPALLSMLGSWMSYPKPPIAWAASRTLAVAGLADPYHRARSDPRFASLLGPKLVELLVFFGDVSDVPLVEAVIRKGPVTPGLLDAIARFGCPKVWAFLVHYLSDADMAGDAADALELLFGERVARSARLEPEAWREGIKGAKLSQDLRYRFGEPWRPSAMVAEYRRGMIGTSALIGRADEVVVRARLDESLDLSAWLPEAMPRLDAFFAAVARADGRLTPGGWECATLRGRARDGSIVAANAAS